MESLIVPFIIGGVTIVILTVIFSIIFKGTPKVDKGFKIFYSKLSYRRKMIRTLTTLPMLFIIIQI